jgi:hypothetical protein
MEMMAASQAATGIYRVPAAVSGRLGAVFLPALESNPRIDQRQRKGRQLIS